MLLDYFTDPILRAPTIGCLLMCVAASLMGVVLLLQKKLLVSESVSHAAYPGAVGGLFVLALLGPEWEEYAFLAVLGGALLSSWLGLKALAYLEKRWKIRSDAALCFTLAVFFGVGIVLASLLQGVLPLWMSQVEMLLFGQAATLTDAHLLVYAALVLASSLFIAISFRPLQALLFDPLFAASTGLRVKPLQRALLWLLLGSIVVGIRSVGVILISGMLIAPAIAARQCSHRLKAIFWFSALFGALSGFFGNVLSVEIAMAFPSIHLPTGPVIVLVGSALALFALLFSPGRGIVFRWTRRFFFQLRCVEENLLKEVWKKGEIVAKGGSILGRLARFRLVRQRWALSGGGMLRLTVDGQTRASSIVRLHRLWELYLTDQLGVNAAKVHRNAEEMEHILTPELEERLTRLLANPKNDPHDQPIPQKKEGL